MNRMELYQMIEIPAPIADKLMQCESGFPLEAAEPYLRMLMGWETAKEGYESLKTYLQEDEGSIKMLFCQLECARRCHAEYRARGISDRVYADTMKCFQRYLHECKKKTGEMYFDRGWWTYRQISMHLFRIGQLEYELCNSRAGKAVSIHIPSDASFTPRDVDESFLLAERFIDRHYPEYSHAGRICESWLLSPALRELLPEESNILNFQRRFRIIDESRDAREFIEWIFQVPKDTELSRLPENTRLQRAAKERLQAGETISEAYGILK